MKNCGHHNVRKHREINNSEQYVILDIYLKFGDIYKMKITSSEPEYYLGRSVKGVITSLGIKSIRRPKIVKKENFAITEVSIKDLSNIIE